MKIEWIVLTAAVIAMSAVFFGPVRDGITQAARNIVPERVECPAADAPCIEFRERR